MVNLTLLSNYINLAVVIGIFFKIYSAYRKHREEPIGKLFLDFGLGYLMLAAYFFIIVAPLTFTSSLWLSGFLAGFTHIFIFLATAMFLVTILDFYGLGEWRPYVISFLAIAGIFTTVLNIIFLKPDILVEIERDFFIFRSDIPVFIRAMDGVAAVGGAIFTALSFLRYAWTNEDRMIRVRSFLIGSGFSGLLGASVLAFFLGGSGSALIIFIGSVLAIPAFFVIMYGLLYGY